MFVASLKVEQVSVNSIFGKTGGVKGGEQLHSSKHDNVNLAFKEYFVKDSVNTERLRLIFNFVRFKGVSLRQHLQIKVNKLEPVNPKYCSSMKQLQFSADNLTADPKPNTSHNI